MGDVGSAVAGPLDGLGSVAAGIALEDAAGHNLCSGYSAGLIASGNTADAYSVVVDCGYRAGNVCAVLVCQSLRSFYETLAVTAILIAPEIVNKVLVCRVDEPVYDSYHHFTVACRIIPPDRIYIDVSTCDTCVQGTVIVIVPLLSEFWVVERSVSASPNGSVGFRYHHILSSYSEYLAVEFHELHFGAVDKEFLCVEKVLGIVELHIIPAMHTLPSGSSFIFFVIWEDSLQ